LILVIKNVSHTNAHPSDIAKTYARFISWNHC